MFNFITAPKLWKCPKGHEILQHAPFTLSWSDADTSKEYNVCQRCYVESIAQQFPIERVRDGTYSG